MDAQDKTSNMVRFVIWID